MRVSKLGKGIDGDVYLVSTGKRKPFAFKTGPNAKHIQFEDITHNYVYDTVSCKKHIVKPLSISEDLYNQILQKTSRR